MAMVSPLIGIRRPPSLGTQLPAIPFGLRPAIPIAFHCPAAEVLAIAREVRNE